MAACSLADLPAELLAPIIGYTIPEGFESLSLSCRSLHTACAPFIPHHNHLRSQFHDFGYHNYRPVSLGYSPLTPRNPTAFELITHIAHNPIIARYIHHADLHFDTWPPRARPFFEFPDSGPVVELFANSPYLRDAGIPWKDYCDLIKDEYSPKPPKRHWTGVRFSQHAAVFLLTLLPNVTTMELPSLWTSTPQSEQLIGSSVRRAARRGDEARPSLAQLTKLVLNRYNNEEQQFSLGQLIPYLALPKLRWLECQRCTYQSNSTTPQELPPPDCNSTLETLHLWRSHIDAPALGNFLRHTPHLKALEYSYDGPEEWEVGQFIAAVESQVGSFLERFSVSMWDSSIGIAPGAVSFRGYQHLRRLSLPVGIVLCLFVHLSIDPHAQLEDQEFTKQEIGSLHQLMFDLLPTSLEKLSLQLDGTKKHVRAVEVMFSNLGARKHIWVPELRDIYLKAKSACDAYETDWVELTRETKAAGVVLHLGEPEADLEDAD